MLAPVASFPGGVDRADVVVAALAADAIKLIAGPQRSELRACGAPVACCSTSRTIHAAHGARTPAATGPDRLVTTSATAEPEVVHHRTEDSDAPAPPAVSAVHRRDRRQEGASRRGRLELRDPERVAGAYTEDTVWRNRDTFLQAERQSSPSSPRSGSASSTTRCASPSGPSPATASRSASSTSAVTPAACGRAATATRTGSSMTTA
jgi:hypothetical protein